MGQLQTEIGTRTTELDAKNAKVASLEKHNKQMEETV
jgi:hypothetical protein